MVRKQTPPRFGAHWGPKSSAGPKGPSAEAKKKRGGGKAPQNSSIKYFKSCVVMFNNILE